MAIRKLFTERMGQPEPRVKETLDAPVRIALLQLVQQRIEDNSFGASFENRCPDGTVNAGVDQIALRASMEGYHVIWPQEALVRNEVTDGQAFDLLEFSYEHIALPIQTTYHGFYFHHHYRYDQNSGRVSFIAEVNRLFERNGVAFHLQDGQIERIAPDVLHEVLDQPAFNTGDGLLDEMLGSARERFLNRDLAVRRESLEKLWDAWERLKSRSDPSNKSNSTKMLLDRASTEPKFRDRLEFEARQLTEIGNEFQIRHAEVNKVPLTESTQVDYMFHRLFAMIRMLLQASGVAI